MTTVWWWVVPPSQTGDASRPADAKLISTPDSGAEYSALVQGGSYGGWSRYQGPFAMKAAAQAASPAGGSTGDVIAAGVGAGVNNDVGVIGSGARAAQAAGSGLSALGQFFGGSSSNWLLRTGEILLGLVLIAVGVAKLTNSVPIATKIASAVS